MEWVSGIGWVGGGGGVGPARGATGGDGGQSYIDPDRAHVTLPGPVKPYIAPPELTPEEVAESGTWLITGKGNVYTLSSIGSRCTFESLREESEGGSSYLDSLDADHATPGEVTAVKAWLRQWLDDGS